MPRLDGIEAARRMLEDSRGRVQALRRRLEVGRGLGQPFAQRSQLESQVRG